MSPLQSQQRPLEGIGLSWGWARFHSVLARSWPGWNTRELGVALISMSDNRWAGWHGARLLVNLDSSHFRDSLEFWCWVR